jgi:hypothetical protein
MFRPDLALKYTVLVFDVAVGAIAVVVGGVPNGGIGQSENAAVGSVAAEEEVVAEMHVGGGIAEEMFADDRVVPNERPAGLAENLKATPEGTW